MIIAYILNKTISSELFCNSYLTYINRPCYTQLELLDPFMKANQKHLSYIFKVVFWFWGGWFEMNKFKFVTYTTFLSY